MIGNYYFKVAVHLNMVLQILSILLELQSYEGLDTNYLASNVLISLSCLYFSVNSLLSRFCKHRLSQAFLSYYFYG